MPLFLNVNLKILAIFCRATMLKQASASLLQEHILFSQSDILCNILKKFLVP